MLNIRKNATTFDCNNIDDFVLTNENYCSLNKKFYIY